MPRAITIHSFEQACAALEAAVEVSAPVLLVSAPDAGLQSGPAWFASLIEQAVEAVPAADSLRLETLLDCGDKPGCVLAALRHGVKDIRFKSTEPVRTKLAEIAESCGAELVPDRPETLDLLGRSDPLEACLDWLRSGSN